VAAATRGAFRSVVFSGGHFFLQDQRAAVLELVAGGCGSCPLIA
jgi:surfactin synthase thioesterase subunit